MKKATFTSAALSLMIFLTLTGCQNSSLNQAGYSKENSKVYYTFEFEGKKKKIWLDDVDFSSFTVLNEFYTKDKNKVYFGGMAFDADPATFQVLKDYFGFDKDTHLYWANQSVQYPMDSLPNLSFDPQTFQILSLDEYIRDKNGVYWLFRGDSMEPLLDVEDPLSFEFLAYGFAKDKLAVYRTSTNYAQKLENIDPQSVEILNDQILKDKNGMYRLLNADNLREPPNVQPLHQVDPASFEILNKTYARDKHNLYEITADQLKIVGDSSTEPGQVTQKCYTKDKDSINYHYELNGGKYTHTLKADSASFEELPTIGCYGKDKYYLYYNERREKILEPLNIQQLWTKSFFEYCSEANTMRECHQKIGEGYKNN